MELSASSLDPATLERLEEFVRPLYAGLDGEQTFDRVERLRVTIEKIRTDESVDGDLLELLVISHGAADRLGSLKRDSRFELFLRGLGLSSELIERLRRGLRRYEASPETPEEALLHDALQLENTGISAMVRALMQAGRKKKPLGRAVAGLDGGAPPELFKTPGARRLAKARLDEATHWLTDLRRRLAAESTD